MEVCLATRSNIMLLCGGGGGGGEDEKSPEELKADLELKKEVFKGLEKREHAALRLQKAWRVRDAVQLLKAMRMLQREKMQAANVTLS